MNEEAMRAIPDNMTRSYSLEKRMGAPDEFQLGLRQWEYFTQMCNEEVWSMRKIIQQISKESVEWERKRHEIKINISTILNEFREQFPATNDSDSKELSLHQRKLMTEFIEDSIKELLLHIANEMQKQEIPDMGFGTSTNFSDGYNRGNEDEMHVIHRLKV